MSVAWEGIRGVAKSLVGRAPPRVSTLNSIEAGAGWSYDGEKGVDRRCGVGYPRISAEGFSKKLDGESIWC